MPVAGLMCFLVAMINLIDRSDSIFNIVARTSRSLHARSAGIDSLEDV